MVNPKMIPITVDKTEFAVTWQDYGSFMRLRVFKNDRALGHKDFPISVDQGQGVVEYSVRSILRGSENGTTERSF